MSKSAPNKQSSQRIVRELFRLSDETKQVIPFKEVTNVIKSPKEARAIEVACGGKTYVFRSFYRSNDALQFIHTLWRNTGAPASEDCGRSSHTGWSDEEDNTEEEKEEAFIIPPDQNANAFETLKAALPVSPQQFFDLFYADNAPFGFEHYFVARGDTEIELAPWVANEEMGGFTRDVKFRTKIRGPPIGPKSTRCEIAQQYTLQPNKLQVKQSCKALDVPFSACFLVEQEWTIYSITPNKSILRISAAINFVKSTMFRSIIENRSKPDITEDHRIWLQEMREKKAFPDIPMQPLPEPKQEEKHHSVTKYPEVDPNLLTKPRSRDSGMPRERLQLIALSNAVGLVFVVLYLLYLHTQLSQRVTVECQ